MRVRRDWKWTHEDLIAQQAGHRYNPATVLLIDGLRLTLEAGECDELTVIQDGKTIFCLAINTGLSYVGVQGWEGQTEKINIFFSGDDLPQALGKTWDSVTPCTLLRRAAAYFDK